MRRALLLALCAAAAAASGGCGAGDDPDPAAAARADDDERQLAFARCMRQNGIDLPDPGAGGGPQRIRVGRGVSPQVVQRAMRECRERTGGGPRQPTDEERQELQDAALKFARCMRANGVDLPDPQPGRGGLIRMAGSPSTDPESPRFRKAEAACRKHLPQRAVRGGR
ncbi:MAG TPA: hypothetical protein VD931_18545 [Baekduia sp.]|nr:hypothetical protein [Baekduia sp.]